ncbi:MAG: bifunctional hydroxymethylpyrimidine kinase/phosphomethylpyrimidine kinase [Pseudomonadota bacterium]
MPKVLTIAGFDSSGGAGIGADLKTIALLGAHGLGAVTALTAQDSTGVHAIHPVPPAFVEQQLEAVLADIGCDACKCGMLYSAGVIKTVSEVLARHGVPNVVLDTVVAASSGDRLMEAGAVRALRGLFPLARLVTGNLAEAEWITGIRVTDEALMRQAAEELIRLGAKAVLVRGGHLEGAEAVDILYDGGEFTRFVLPRVATAHDHGTGCALTAAIATYLARGHGLVEATWKAKELVHQGLKAARSLGAGKGPVNIFAAVAMQTERCRVLEELAVALDTLRRHPAAGLMPEVGMNLAFALPGATATDLVAAFPGRLGLHGGRITPFGPPRFGASSHVARIVLTAMRHDATLRAALNIRYDERTLAACGEAGLRLARFDRAQEPPEVAATEGSSLVWGVAAALGTAEEIPQAIYDLGAHGKEPMIRLIGRTPHEVVGWAMRIAEFLGDGCNEPA